MHCQSWHQAREHLIVKTNVTELLLELRLGRCISLWNCAIGFRIMRPTALTRRCTFGVTPRCQPHSRCFLPSIMLDSPSFEIISSVTITVAVPMCAVRVVAAAVTVLAALTHLALVFLAHQQWDF